MQGEIRPHITNGSVSLDDGAIQDVKNHLQVFLKSIELEFNHILLETTSRTQSHD